MLSPPLSILDSTLYDLGCDDSNAHLSRPRARTTTDDSGQVDLQHYLDSPRSSPSLTSHSTSTVSSSSSYLSPLSSSYLSTPAPAFSPFPELSPEILNGEWDENNTRIQESPEPYECSQPESALPETGTVAMSAAALSLDSSFSMSGKESFPWPGMMANHDANANLLGHDLSIGPSSDGGYSSAGRSRSTNGSPPRQPLSAEQRELKRQMEQARRESKSAARFRRSNSNPYLADATTPALNVPAYTSPTPPVSLLAEPATSSVPGQSYLSAYNQPLQEPESAGLSGVPMYGAPMQQQSMQPAYNVPLDFSQTYHQQPSPSYQQQQPSPSYHRARPASLSVGNDPSSILYPVPNVMTPTTNGAGVPSPSEQHHVRMVQGRPKPQCWEHGCNGRQFSTFSNLLRHQREKSGQASKASCPNCGAEFTRTTARNGHLLQGKCKKRGEEEGEEHLREA